MARVIKAGAGQKPARPLTRVHVDAGPNKVIARDVYQAKQDAEHILMRAEQERKALLADGKKRAVRAREEAMARGASEAFAAAASEALIAFRKRAERYTDASDDMRVLALEVVRKILGTDPEVSAVVIDDVLRRGMAQLRARRRVRVQVSELRLSELAGERPNLMKALHSEPEIIVEGVDDVGAGFARVVTEIGGALCAEETALEALALAVNVREQPQPRAQQRTAAAASDPFEDLDADADAETMNVTAPIPRVRARPGSFVEEIEVEEDSELTQARPRPTTSAPGGLSTSSHPMRARPPTIGTQRPAPRAVALPTDEQGLIQRAPPLPEHRVRDEDLDLFTDEVPRKPR